MNKVYFYPGSRDPSLHERDGYVDCVPFSPQGVAKWIKPTDNPDEAQLFYCGQFHDKDAWKLNPNKFEFFQGRESRHVFDIEGDWRGMEIPEWLRPCVMTAMNVPERNRSWNIMARPGCSKLLVHLAREAQSEFGVPTKKHFFFRGQRDSRNLREKVYQILRSADLPYRFMFNLDWSAVKDIAHPDVVEYQQIMRESAFVLCPAGEGQATLRMYEACYFGRIPIVIADCLWTWEDVTDISFCLRIPSQMSEDEMFKALIDIFSISDSELEDRCRMAALYFEHVVRRYFDDPTEFFLTWIKRRALM